MRNTKTESKSETENGIIKPNWTRNCPICNDIINYGYKWNFSIANKKNSICGSCAKMGKNNPMYGKPLSKEHKELLNWKGRHHSEETKEKLRILNLGECNPAFGRIYPEEHRQRLSKLQSGVNHSQYGTHRSAETKRKLRLARIELLKNTIFNGGIVVPIFNTDACNLFEQINNELRWNGVYGSNGGEFHIKELGYWVDYYEPNLNIVIEYDEYKNHHSTRDMERDRIRQNEIVKHLKCQFYRIKENEASNWRKSMNLVD